MPMLHGRMRHLPLLSAALATLLAGAAGAQTTSPEQDAGFRHGIPGAGTSLRPGVPGGIVTLHRPGDPDDRSGRTRTPIKHVILLIGENRTFDHVYATYTLPKGQTIRNLLSEGIVQADGTPGPNVALARHWRATDTGKFSLAPTRTEPYAQLPAMNTGGAPTQPYFASAAQAEAVEPGLPAGEYGQLASGGTGLPKHVIDTRFPTQLPNAPVDASASLSYDDYANSPVHRFFQMWQQLDCSTAAATPSNPSGCRNDLFPWVETSVGAGSNGKAQPVAFDDQTTGEGATAMQFLNMAKGDAPYFA